MSKNIFLSAALIFGIHPVLYSMKSILQNNLDCFTITTNDADSFQGKNLNLRLRRVELEKLHSPITDQEKKDRASFIKILSDFDANKSSFGPDLAQHLKTLPPDVLLASFIQMQESKIEKMQDRKVMIHWVIEDLDNNNAFVGRVSIHTYTNNRPETHKNKLLLSFGLTIADNYRNQKLLSRVAPLVLNTLALHKEFNNAQFCFDTDQDNIAMHKVAKKMNAQKIYSWEREITIERQTFTRNTELFIIPKAFYIAKNNLRNTLS